MLSKFKIPFISLVLSLFFISCNQPSQETSDGQKKKTDPSESLIKANRYLVKAEEEDIRNYIRRHGWEMQESGSGLRYWIFEKGTGRPAKKGMVAELKYSLWLINGELIYTSDSLGTKSFLIGKGGVESGLEEAILLMHEGDKARLILPSHLAFGLLGDEQRIPPRAAIVYELELINLK